jgi:nitrate reductase delta subunit
LIGGAGRRRSVLGTFRKSKDEIAALTRIEAWVRARFKLTEDETVFVTEVQCALPGCPPVETLIAFWTRDATRHHFKVFKPAAAVAETDLPPGWYKSELIDDGRGCECC